MRYELLTGPDEAQDVTRVIRHAIYRSGVNTKQNFVMCVNRDGREDHWARFVRIDGGVWEARPRDMDRSPLPEELAR